MKIALSASQKDLDSTIDPRFGRCAYFLIINPDDMSFDCFENESANLGGGAGIQAAQFVVSHGATVVITGNMGPNAVNALSSAGVEIITGINGSIKTAVEQYIKGNFDNTVEPNVPEHHGINSPQGTGADMGTGAGMGTGRGMGGGRGIGGGGRGMGGGGGKGMGGGSGMGGGRGMGGGGRGGRKSSR